MDINDLVRAEDEAEGRYLDRWRYWLGCFAVVSANMSGVISASLDWPIWLRAVSFIPSVAAFTSAFSSIRRRKVSS